MGALRGAAPRAGGVGAAGAFAGAGVTGRGARGEAPRTPTGDLNRGCSAGAAGAVGIDGV